MGDRANIFFVDAAPQDGKLHGIYLYTHWGGSALASTLRAALERGKSRWGDSQYLARIIFSEMIQDDVLEETGFGIGTRMGDNEHRIIRVDDTAGMVSFHEPGSERDPASPGVASFSYDEYVGMSAEDLDAKLVAT